MIEITPHITLYPHELHITAVRSSGPGGQHVNTTNSAVQLKFNAAYNASISPSILERLRKLAGRRMTEDGTITLRSDTHKSQHMNRLDAEKRLFELIRAAAKKPKRRVSTKPTRASKERRLKAKSHASALKKNRSKVRTVE